jgi:uncharacterized membrane protein
MHILGATVLFGTGIGTAFFMFKAYLSKNDEAMAVTTQNVVVADWLFTTPAIVVQLVTGLWLTDKLNISFSSIWFIAVISLYVFVGFCWIPVVWIQIRIRDLIAADAKRGDYQKMMRSWLVLGILAFTSVLVLFYLMVSKFEAYG